MRHDIIAIALLGLWGMASPVHAQAPQSNIGTLTCTLTDDASTKPGKMSCGFKSATSATEEKYDGTVRGLAHINAGKQVLMWSVLAPAGTEHSTGFLAQLYQRAKRPGHPPSWTGERVSGIALIFETHADSELGASITELELKVATTPV